MAMCDYRACDVCGKKTFYDAELNYRWDDPIAAQQKVQGHEYYLDWLGDWAVVCIDCTRTHQITIEKRSDKTSEVE